MSLVVVGGGPAGSAAAIALASAGKDVVLIEKSSIPSNKVCGEFLSHEACGYLDDLGVDLRTLGAVDLRTVRLCQGQHTGEVELPFAAMSLSRCRLDEALLDRAAQAGVTLHRGLRASELIKQHAGYDVQLVDGSRLSADEVFVAVGKHDLRNHKRQGGFHNRLVAFKMHYELEQEQARELAGAVELHLFDSGYAGLQTVENGRANLCLLIEADRLRALGGSFENLRRSMCQDAPLLSMRLAHARARWQRPLALSSIPYGYVRSKSEGPWYLGDQAAVIPSFSGDGISIALHSAALACTHYLQGAPATTFQRTLARQLRTRVAAATLLSRGLVQPRSQRFLAMVARVWPGLVAAVATSTRIPGVALASARSASKERAA